MEEAAKGPEDIRDDTKNTAKGISDPLSGRTATGNDTLNPSSPPHVEGEQSVSGDMPDPQSDDDVSEMANDAGLYTDEKEGQPGKHCRRGRESRKPR